MAITNLRQLLDRPATKVAPDILGWHLIHQTADGVISGIIVETEAYMGQIDPASHAFRGLTSRNGVMFGPAGRAYIYFTYGMHYCMNVVTGPVGQASAVLIRALQPLEGTDLMAVNRGLDDPAQLTNGPAKLTQALGIEKRLNGHDLSKPPLLLEPGQALEEIVCGPRIGITAAVTEPWRFYFKHNQYVSRPRIRTS